MPNPKYTNALRLDRPTYNIPKTVMLYEIRGNALTLPRGMAEEVAGKAGRNHRPGQDPQRRAADL